MNGIFKMNSKTKFALFSLGLIAACASSNLVLGKDYIAAVEGKQVEVRHGKGGEVLGHEYYIPNSNKVVWKSADGQCFNGEHRFDSGAVCFTYQGLEGESCHITRKDGQYFTSHDLYIEVISSQPLSCQ